MTRLWLDARHGKIAGVLSLTDEQALALLERGAVICDGAAHCSVGHAVSLFARASF